MSFISAIGTATPSHRFSQPVIADFMLRAMTLNNGDERKLRTVFRSSGIAYRHSVLADYGKVRNFTFYSDTVDLEPFPGTQKRLEVFRAQALTLSLASVNDLLRSYSHVDLSTITHLVVVCCTGMYAPGLDIDLVSALNLSPAVHRTAINFMGCYAAFNAMKIADACCRSDVDSKVLIVCTELCSLHFQRPGTDDNILANALFADGSASILVEGRTPGALRLRLEQFHSALATEGRSDMAWTIGDMGFEMRLSSYVPDLIRKGIGHLTNTLLQKSAAKISDIHHFAIHPGGKRILEVVQEELPITKRQIEPAYYVLRNFGNMSSPTVLFVIKEIVDSLNGSNNGERMMAIAFGPGLTLESMIVTIENTKEHA